MTRGLQMRAFLRQFMERSEGMQGNPDPLSPLEQPCLVFPQWKPFPGERQQWKFPLMEQKEQEEGGGGQSRAEEGLSAEFRPRPSGSGKSTRHDKRKGKVVGVSNGVME